MKKTIVLFLSFLLLISFASCVKSDFPDSSEKSSIQTTSQIKAMSKTTYKTTNLTQKEANKLSKQSIDNSETKAVSTNKEIIDNTPPYILILNIDELKQIKSVLETMSETDFTEYMSENFSSAVMNGMDTKTNTHNLISNLYHTNILLIDGNYSEQKFHYYTEYQDISYRVYIDDSLCLRCTSYVEGRNEPFFKENEHMQIDKTYETDALKIEVFKYTQEESNEVFGNIYFNDEYIMFRADIGITPEDFEHICQRLSIAKIGDLLNE